MAEELEERDLHYSSVLRTRKLTVAGIEPSVEAASDDEHDVMLLMPSAISLSSRRSLSCCLICLTVWVKAWRLRNPLGHQQSVLAAPRL
jgi:hypothetical protein